MDMTGAGAGGAQTRILRQQDVQIQQLKGKINALNTISDTTTDDLTSIQADVNLLAQNIYRIDGTAETPNSMRQIAESATSEHATNLEYVKTFAQGVTLAMGTVLAPEVTFASLAASALEFATVATTAYVASEKQQTIADLLNVQLNPVRERIKKIEEDLHINSSGTMTTETNPQPAPDTTTGTPGQGGGRLLSTDNLEDIGFSIYDKIELHTSQIGEPDLTKGTLDERLHAIEGDGVLTGNVVMGVTVAALSVASIAHDVILTGLSTGAAATAASLVAVEAQLAGLAAAQAAAAAALIAAEAAQGVADAAQLAADAATAASIAELTTVTTAHTAALGGTAAALTALQLQIDEIDDTLTEHTTSITTHTTDITALNTRMTTFETQGNAVVAEGFTRVTALEQTVVSHATSITSLTSTNTSQTSAISALQSVDASHGTRLTDLETAVTALEAGGGGGGGSYATTADLAATNANVTSNASAISTLQSNVTALSTFMSSLDGEQLSQSTALTELQGDLLKTLMLLRADMFMSAFMKQLEGPVFMKSFSVVTQGPQVASNGYLTLEFAERSNASTVIYAPLALPLTTTYASSNASLAASNLNIAIKAPVELNTLLADVVSSRGMVIPSWATSSINTNAGTFSSTMRFRDSASPTTDQNLYNCMYMMVRGYFRTSIYYQGNNYVWKFTVRQHSVTYINGEAITGAQVIGEQTVRGTALNVFADILIPFNTTLFKAFDGVTTDANIIYLSVSVQNLSANAGTPQTQTYDNGGTSASMQIETILKFLPTRYTWDAVNISQASDWFGSDNAL